LAGLRRRRDAVVLVAPWRRNGGAKAAVGSDGGTVAHAGNFCAGVGRIGTDEPPETIYQIYLGLPPGVAPDPNGIYYVGSLNFFSAVGRSAEAGQADPRFLSFDVTALLRTLQSRNSLGDNTTVTIVPAGSPRAGAKPVIAEVALVEQ